MIILLGFPKAATCSFSFGLERLGYRVAHHTVPPGFLVGMLIEKAHYDGKKLLDYLPMYDAFTEISCTIPDDKMVFWPQMTHLHKFKEEYPDALFILNYRNAASLLDSIKRWNNFYERLTNSNLPNLPAGKPPDEDWINQHYNNVQQIFAGSANYLFVDIESPEAGDQIRAFLKAPTFVWEKRHQNTGDNREMFFISKAFRN